MLEGGMGGQDRVVRLNNGAGELRRGIDAELELGLLAVVGGEFLQEEGSETRSGSTTKGVEDEEALETRAVVGEPPQLVHDGVDELLSDCVVATRVCKREVRRVSDDKTRGDDSQLFAASSLPEIMVSGWNRER